LLAGDIIPFKFIDRFKDFFDYVSDNFEEVYWLPGNHEYYYFDVATKTGKLFEKIRKNVFLVNNVTIKHENVRLIFSTLWSKISDDKKIQISRGISDFHVVKYKDEVFSPDDFNHLHNESIDFIKQELNEKTADKTIVISHHTPTLINYPEIYKGSILNEAFAVELSDIIKSSAIDYWIYGHHHYNTLDFKIGDTQMLTNQLGYVRRNEHQLFNPNKFINNW
jgi:DNA repair exonuclease SbcCD nuclease subunit